ncbi:MAG: VOC family protein [Alphaproteobacteria bacterium]|nr:VOC family protein [Alphaproteobacteria bacterium]
MNLPGLTFHHLGLAVKKEDDALTMLRLQGYATGEKIFDPLQNVHVRLCTSADMPAVEIVSPPESGESPIDALIAQGSRMYHICYETPDLGKSLAVLEDAGLRCVPLAERKPAVLFGGRHVSFYNIPGFTIIELLEET